MLWLDWLLLHTCRAHKTHLIGQAYAHIRTHCMHMQTYTCKRAPMQGHMCIIQLQCIEKNVLLMLTVVVTARPPVMNMCMKWWMCTATTPRPVVLLYPWLLLLRTLPSILSAESANSRRICSTELVFMQSMTFWLSGSLFLSRKLSALYVTCKCEDGHN